MSTRLGSSLGSATYQLGTIRQVTSLHSAWAPSLKDGMTVVSTS